MIAIIEPPNKIKVWQQHLLTTTFKNPPKDGINYCNFTPMIILTYKDFSAGQTHYGAQLTFSETIYMFTHPNDAHCQK